MSLASILAQVVTVLESVSGLGPQLLVGPGTLTMTPSRVHLGLRQFKSREHWKSAALDPLWSTPHYHIWFVTRGKTVEEHLSTGSNVRSHSVTCAGYYGLYDPTDDPSDTAVIGTEMTSEVTFSGKVEAVCDALRNDGALHGGGVATNTTPPQVVTWEIRTIDETQCHYVEIQFECEEELLISYTGA